MPQIEINASCDNCDFVRTYYNVMPSDDDLLEDFYHCSNDNCWMDICIECMRQCDFCHEVFCENCIDDADVHECTKKDNEDDDNE